MFIAICMHTRTGACSRLRAQVRIMSHDTTRNLSAACAFCLHLKTQARKNPGSRSSEALKDGAKPGVGAGAPRAGAPAPPLFGCCALRFALCVLRFAFSGAFC